MKNFPTQLEHASGSPMQRDPARLLLAFRRAPPRDALARLLAELGLSLENGDASGSAPGESVNHSLLRVFVTAQRPISQDHYERIEQAAGPLDLDWIGPLYHLAGENGRRALLAPLPHAIVVRLRQREGVAHELRGPLLLDGNAAAPQLHEMTEKSRHLQAYRYFQIANPREVNAFELRRRLERDSGQLVLDVQFETMPLLRPAATSDDVPQARRWDLKPARTGTAAAAAARSETSSGATSEATSEAKSGATSGETSAIKPAPTTPESKGAASVVVCVLDGAIDPAHPALRGALPGLNLGTMRAAGAVDGSARGAHGTECAALVAHSVERARSLDGIGPIPGQARILPLAFDCWTDVEVANGIGWASANGAAVISMSFGCNGWSNALIDPSIAHAFSAGALLCAATHNHGGAITYPATHALVLAVGCWDEDELRDTPANGASLSRRASNAGPALSVVAPGAAANSVAGSSAATARAAALAALVRMVYPGLSNEQVRALIERSAAKVGSQPYTNVAGHPNGSWNQALGYGRIDVQRALDLADVFIRNAPGDHGEEAFTGGNGWDCSDIVVRSVDDGVVVPNDPLQAKAVIRGQENFIYVRVTNNGPHAARNVRVSLRVAPCVGLEYVYPHDWQAGDAQHVIPAALVSDFSALAPHASALARFRLSAEQTEQLHGWDAGQRWHPTLLAQVTADNDYAFAGRAPGAHSNNVAQRNLSVVDAAPGARLSFPFSAGSRHNAARSMTLLIDRSRLPAAMPLLLSLDDAGNFPAQAASTEPGEAIVFLERTRIQTILGNCQGVLTLEQGSRFELAPVPSGPGEVRIDGGDVILRAGRRYLALNAPLTTLTVDKLPGRVYRMSLQTTLPATALAGEQFLIQIAQQDGQGRVAGGAAVVYVTS